VAPSQIVSVAASLIPFLEHDDANRALMGSNMQRQACPACARRSRWSAPAWKGLLRRFRDVRNSAAWRYGRLRRCKSHRGARQRRRDRRGDVGVDIYKLTKYTRSNQNTNINQRPIVKQGERLAKGDVVADGASTTWASSRSART